MNIKLSRADLATKSPSQLAALFNQLSNCITVNTAEIASAQSLLAMISLELGRRGPAP